MNDPFDAETMAGLRRCAKYIAMVVRNAMEDFHCRHLSDEQMAELNPIIRNAIYTALYAYHSEKDSKAAARFVHFHLMSIPKCWEEPELLTEFRNEP
ncbi:MAG: hypothetical protein ABFE01_11950 [Phycisphaerales bacterium]|jgi:hypothetical protein